MQTNDHQFHFPSRSAFEIRPRGLRGILWFVRLSALELCDQWQVHCSSCRNFPRTQDHHWYQQNQQIQWFVIFPANFQKSQEMDFFAIFCGQIQLKVKMGQLPTNSSSTITETVLIFLGWKPQANFWTITIWWVWSEPMKCSTKGIACTTGRGRGQRKKRESSLKSSPSSLLRSTLTVITIKGRLSNLM